MRVFVTGHSGFVGSALVPYLETQGHEVTPAGRELVGAALAGCEAVVHLANIAHGRVQSKLLRHVNVEGTRRAAQLAAAHKVRRVVYLSSVKAIGEETSGKPFDEHSNGRCRFTLR